MDFQRSQLERDAKLDPMNGRALVSALKARARFGDSSSYLEVLQDRERWNWSPKEVQDLAIKEVTHRLRDQFHFVETESYSCQDLTHRIAIYKHEKTELDFLLIPGGPAHSGTDSPEQREGREGVIQDLPPIETCVRPFLLSKYPVTQWNWSRLRNVIPIPIRQADFPAVQNSWLDCKNWLQSCESELRFPTEIEWEYAARAGSDTQYFWGDNFDKNYCTAELDQRSGQTHSVLVHDNHPNAFGLVDMLGHVWEFTESAWWDSRRDHATIETQARTIRGGSMFGSQNLVRCGSRSFQWLSEVAPDVGLRAARSL